MREVGYRQSTTSMDVMTVIGAGGGAGGVVVAAGLSKAGAAARADRDQAILVHGEMGKFFPMPIARLPHAHLAKI